MRAFFLHILPWRCQPLLLLAVATGQDWGGAWRNTTAGCAAGWVSHDWACADLLSSTALPCCGKVPLGVRYFGTLHGVGMSECDHQSRRHCPLEVHQIASHHQGEEAHRIVRSCASQRMQFRRVRQQRATRESKMPRSSCFRLGTVVPNRYSILGIPTMVTKIDLVTVVR
jgi:hypothetical protein